MKSDFHFVVQNQRERSTKEMAEMCADIQEALLKYDVTVRGYVSHESAKNLPSDMPCINYVDWRGSVAHLAN